MALALAPPDRDHPGRSSSLGGGGPPPARTSLVPPSRSITTTSKRWRMYAWTNIACRRRIAIANGTSALPLRLPPPKSFLTRRVEARGNIATSNEQRAAAVEANASDSTQIADSNLGIEILIELCDSFLLGHAMDVGIGEVGHESTLTNGLRGKRASHQLTFL